MRQGRIIRILDRSTVVINLGEIDGVKSGTRFGIFTPEDRIVDPEKNEDLGTYRRRKATVEARSVHPRFTVASPPRATRIVEPPAVARQRGLAGSSALLGALGGTTRQEAYQPQLPVSPEEIEPLPTGDSIQVGDLVEELPPQ